MEIIKRFCAGIMIGAGAILPGISSGVFCVIFGIYEKLVNSVLGLFKNFKQNFSYLFPIGVGMIFGVFIFGKILNSLISTFPIPSKLLFIGLILGCVPFLFKKATNKSFFRIRDLCFLIFSFFIGTVLILLENTISNNLYLSNNILFFIISGFFMSFGVIIPGISSTAILLCLGVYETYLLAISTLDFFVLIPMAIGLIFGCLFCLKLISYLFKSAYTQTFYSIIGFLFSSIFAIFPKVSFDISTLFGFLFLILGFFIGFIFEKKEEKNTDYN